MQVLVVDGFLEGTDDLGLADATISILQDAGNNVDYLSLAAPEFSGFMSAAERRAYESDMPLIAEDSKASARRLQAADSLLLIYPTTLRGVPAVMKSWIERVCVKGVSFDFNSAGRVRPALTNVRRLGAITSTPQEEPSTSRRRDLGYRTIMRTLRLNCHSRCRRTFVRLSPMSTAAEVDAQLRQALQRWR